MGTTLVFTISQKNSLRSLISVGNPNFLYVSNLPKLIKFNFMAFNLLSKLITYSIDQNLWFVVFGYYFWAILQLFETQKTHINNRTFFRTLRFLFNLHSIGLVLIFNFRTIQINSTDFWIDSKKVRIYFNHFF